MKNGACYLQKLKEQNPKKINDFRLNFMGLENSIAHYRQSLL